MWDEVCGQEEEELCSFGESFKRLKNLVERLAVLRKHRGKREGRNCGVWRIKVRE